MGIFAASSLVEGRRALARVELRGCLVPAQGEFESFEFSTVEEGLVGVLKAAVSSNESTFFFYWKPYVVYYKKGRQGACFLAVERGSVDTNSLEFVLCDRVAVAFAGEVKVYNDLNCV